MPHHAVARGQTDEGVGGICIQTVANHHAGLGQRVCALLRADARRYRAVDAVGRIDKPERVRRVPNVRARCGQREHAVGDHGVGIGDAADDARRPDVLRRPGRRQAGRGGVGLNKRRDALSGQADGKAAARQGEGADVGHAQAGGSLITFKLRGAAVVNVERLACRTAAGIHRHDDHAAVDIVSCDIDVRLGGKGGADTDRAGPDPFCELAESVAVLVDVAVVVHKIQTCVRRIHPPPNIGVELIVHVLAYVLGLLDASTHVILPKRGRTILSHPYAFARRDFR